VPIKSSEVVDKNRGFGMLQHSSLCEGYVHHRRVAPRLHEFRHKLKMIWLDLDETDQLDDLPFWSSRSWALMRYRRQDFLLPHDLDLKEAVYKKLKEHQVTAKAGRVVLLAQLRSWGHSFNPVVFYFCYDQHEYLYAIVAEITNTPWGERHQYVLESPNIHSHYFEFDKEFHVSPFMPMELRYCWRFRVEKNHVAINMRLQNKEDTVFSALMALDKTPLTRSKAIRTSLGHPLMSFGGVLDIYWQAFRLWLKKVPFYTHPKNTVRPAQKIVASQTKNHLVDGE
jgi:DUF1365 family protein